MQTNFNQYNNVQVNNERRTTVNNNNIQVNVSYPTIQQNIFVTKNFYIDQRHQINTGTHRPRRMFSTDVNRMLIESDDFARYVIVKKGNFSFPKKTSFKFSATFMTGFTHACKYWNRSSNTTIINNVSSGGSGPKNDSKKDNGKAIFGLFVLAIAAIAGVWAVLKLQEVDEELEKNREESHKILKEHNINSNQEDQKDGKINAVKTIAMTRIRILDRQYEHMKNSKTYIIGVLASAILGGVGALFASMLLMQLGLVGLVISIAAKVLHSRKVNAANEKDAKWMEQTIAKVKASENNEKAEQEIQKTFSNPVPMEEYEKVPLPQVSETTPEEKTVQNDSHQPSYNPEFNEIETQKN